jgi:hypothetical protein
MGDYTAKVTIWAGYFCASRSLSAALPQQISTSIDPKTFISG